MRTQIGHSAPFIVLMGLIWTCPAASAQVAKSYQLPHWYGRGSYVVLIDVSNVESDNYYEMAGRALEIAGLAKRAKASCLVVEDAHLICKEGPQPTQYFYRPVTTYPRVAVELGLNTGLAIPSVGQEATEEFRGEWATRSQDLIERGDFDYVALPDDVSVSAFQDGSIHKLYRREPRRALDRLGWGFFRETSGLSQWRVLRLPELAQLDESLAFAVIGTTEGSRKEGETPRRAMHGPEELEVTLGKREGASRQFIYQLLDAAGHASNTRLRLRLTLRTDGSIDDAEFATLQQVAEWMEAYGRPWEFRRISPPGSATQQVLEVSEGLRVVEGSSKIWVVGDAWPDGGIRLPELDRDNAHEVVAVRLVGTQEMLRWEQGDEWGTGLTIQPPEEMPNNLPWVVEIDYMNTVP